MKDIIPRETIEQKIYLIRGHKVMLDRDLAELYGVTTFNLNKAVKRNSERFPTDFMFQLSLDEYTALRFQIGISKKGRGGRRFRRPFASTDPDLPQFAFSCRELPSIAVLTNVKMSSRRSRRD